VGHVGDGVGGGVGDGVNAWARGRAGVRARGHAGAWARARVPCEPPANLELKFEVQIIFRRNL
jgi:hypothetical protein